MRIGLIIVGDEILSGRRADKHLAKVVDMLNARGLQLGWVKVIGDDKPLLDETYRQSFASGDLVFSTGGIGATPDDLTREAVAKVLGVSLERHSEGLKLLEESARLRKRTLKESNYRLIDFPQNAQLIPNPVNKIPGFSIGTHHFVPGFPEMAWPMIEWVLDTQYQHLFNNQYVERAIIAIGKNEGELIPVLESIDKQYPELKIFCLPNSKNNLPHNELGLKGNLSDVKVALEELKRQLTAIDCQWQNIE